VGDSKSSLLVLGLGNLLCADDGVGVRAVESIQRDYQTGEAVRVIDGGTLGLTLLSTFDGADDVVLVDAVAGVGPPGTLVRLAGDDVAPAVRNRLSCHQVGVADLLDSLRLLDSYPERLILWGVVPASFELDTSLSPAVADALPTLVERVLEEVRNLGYSLLSRRNAIRDAPIDPAAAPGSRPVRV